ncbi:MAG TPA: VWA domain-containing protein [Pyrinomonadaceae bacterium]|nr:VWA domain-containing protein [Pyrinomonadaceae bacterium]
MALFQTSFRPSLLAFAAAALLLFIAPPAAFAQDDSDDEVIRIETNLVIINAVVTDKQGKHVAGLKRADFKVFENGVEQDIESADATFTAEETPYAAVLLLDTSGSMEARVALARSAGIKFLEGLRDSDVATIYNFDSEVKQIQEFSGSRDLAPVAFDLKGKGMTALNDAVVEAAKALSVRPEKRRAIIVLSDGADTLSRASQAKALNAALAVNATIYTVDMAAFDEPGGATMSTGGSANARMARLKSVGALKTFAEKSGGRFVPVAGGPALREAFKQIAEELGVQYTIGYQPKNLTPDGKWRAIEVKVARPNAQVRSRKGYNAPKAAKR